MKVTACIPCFNAAGTLGRAIESVRAQTALPDEIIVIDDGSMDGSAAVAERAGARVVRNEVNLGRGAARARAINEARGELVLFCDAGMALDASFLARAWEHLRDLKVAGAFGWVESAPRNVAERWRERHLLKSRASKLRNDRALLATGGALLRRRAVLAAGNFDPGLRAGEDADLGRRLLEAKWKVVFAPDLKLDALGADSVRSVLRRYARWNNAAGQPGWSHYPGMVAYSVRSMMAQDLKAGDLPGAMLSLVCPHYQFWSAQRAQKKGAARGC